MNIWFLRVKSFFAPTPTQKLDFLREHIEEGRIRAVVEKEFPLSKMVRAHRYYERGHLKGKVVVKAV